MLKINFGAAALVFICLMAFSALGQDTRTTEIKFAKGKSSGVYKGHISKTEGVQHYEFSARAGQTVTISVSAPGNNVKFFLFASGSAGKLNDERGSKSFSEKLEDDGDYVITVQSTRGAADFTLKLSIR